MSTPKSKYSYHGMEGTRTYRCWVNMKTRCYNEKSDRYSVYGGRGIKVCEKWHSFSGFFEDMGVCPEGKQLDRKDVNGDYTKKNCHWVTPLENAANKQKSILCDGKPMSRRQFVMQKLGLTEKAVYTRIRRGWDHDKAWSTPKKVST